MNNRLKQLREIINLSQNEFAEQIGIARSTLSLLEKGERILQDRHIKLICQTFNVNEDWLRNGNQPIFKEKGNDIQTLLQKEYGLSELASSIIKSYIELPNEEQKIFEKFVFNVFKEIQEKNSKEQVEEEYTLTFEELVGDPEEVLREEKEKQKRKEKEEAS